MLVQKQKYSKDDIASFKIMNGDEIIAKVESEDDTHYVLSKPTTLVPSQNGVVLMQSMISADPNDNFALAKTHVMLHSKTKDQLADHYREVTTGIQTVRKGGIITG